MLEPVRRVTLTFVLMLASVASSLAETQPPELRNVTLGLNAQVRNRFWAPLVIEIVNPGPAQTLTVSAETYGEKSGQRTVFQRQVWVPGNTRRRIDFPVLPDLRFAADPTASDIRAAFNVRLTDGAAHVWHEMEALAQVVPEETFSVLIADSRYLSYTFLKNQTMGPERRPLTRSVLQPHNLPKRPLYYHGIDAAIIGNLGDQPLTPLQHRALRDWVRGGGHLIVAPGDVLPDAQLADLLPVYYFSTNVVETIPGIAADQRFPAGVKISRMLIRDGEVVLGSRNAPLAVTRREGLGRVTALAMDTGGDEMQRWAGAREFFLQLLATPSFLNYADRIMERSQAIEGMLSSLAGIKVPSRRDLLGYIAVVVGSLLLVLLVFRFTRAPEWGWAIAAVLAIGGSIAAVAAASSWKGQPSPFLVELFVLTGRSGSESGNAQAALGLFSPHEYSYQVDAIDDTQEIRPGPSHVTPPEDFSLTYEGKASLPLFRVRADDIRLVYGRGTVNAVPASDRRRALGAAAERGVDSAFRFPLATARFGANGLSLIYSNTTAIALEDGFLKYNRFIVPLGDIEPGKQLARPDLREASGLFSARLVRNPEDELRARLRGVFFPEPVFTMNRTFSFEERRFYSQFRGTEAGPVVYGWSNRTPSSLFTVRPTVARRATGLWGVEANLEFVPGEVMVPRGVMALRLRSKSAATSAAGNGRFFGSRPTRLLLEFSLPPGWPELDVHEASVHLEFRGSAFVPQIALAPANWSGEDTDDDTSFKVLAGSGHYRVPSPAKYYQPATRSMVVAVNIEAAGSGQPSEQTILGLSSWQVREIDVELKGKTR